MIQLQAFVYSLTLIHNDGDTDLGPKPGHGNAYHLDWLPNLKGPFGRREKEKKRLKPD